MSEHAPYLRLRATAVWLVLVVATVISWILGVDHGSLFSDVSSATVIVVAIAFLKVQLVGAFFMELEHAPRRLMLLFSGWVIVTCAVVTVIYLLG